MAQQTAVEWLIEQIEQYTLTFGPIPSHKLNHLKQQAKQMEKEQIINAHLTGLVYPLEMDASKQAEQYYKDNYKK